MALKRLIQQPRPILGKFTNLKYFFSLGKKFYTKSKSFDQKLKTEVRTASTECRRITLK
jgi:hypothetical protein